MNKVLSLSGDSAFHLKNQDLKNFKNGGKKGNNGNLFFSPIRMEIESSVVTQSGKSKSFIVEPTIKKRKKSLFTRELENNFKTPSMP